MVSPQPRLRADKRAGHFPLAVDGPTAAIWTLAAAGVLALVVFDLTPPLAFNDDWMYAWSVRQLVAGHGLHVFPESSALALVQVVWGTVLSLGHPDPRLLRLSIVPMVVLTAWCTYWLARHLGADRFWSAVAGAALIGMPLFMGNATTFMTDNVYVGLVMAIAVTCVGWVTQGRWRWLCVGLLVVAPLERQVGLALVPAVTLGLVLWRRASWTRMDSAAAAAMWILPAAALYAATQLAIDQPLYSALSLKQLNPMHALFPLPVMLGLGLIPFAASLAFQPRAVSANSESGWSLAAALFGVIGVLGCLVDLSMFGMTFTGNVFSPLGFSAILSGPKPPIFPGWLFRALEIAATVTFIMLLIIRRHWWSPRRLARESMLLLLISASQLLPLLAVGWFIYDRYYLPILAPLVPLIAVVATGAAHQRESRIWAGLALAAGLLLYGIAEQDYLAWQAARDQAARLAYQQVPADQVQAGFEANAVYVELPRFERTGRADLFAILGPAHPKITLQFADASDRRPGVSYSSLAPGRIVLAKNQRD